MELKKLRKEHKKTQKDVWRFFCPFFSKTPFWRMGGTHCGEMLAVSRRTCCSRYALRPGTSPCAVVGSSAIISAGRQIRAMAIITRCFMKKAITDQTMTKTQMTEKVRYRITMKTMAPITMPAKIPEKPIPELTILRL